MAIKLGTQLSAGACETVRPQPQPASPFRSLRRGRSALETRGKSAKAILSFRSRAESSDDSFHSVNI